MTFGVRYVERQRMNRHKRISLIKSWFRIAGCVGVWPILRLAPNAFLALVWLSVWFLVAETLGILEEVDEP